MIRIFYHCACLGDWRDVVGRHIETIRASGLWDAAGEINVCVAKPNDRTATPQFPAKYKIKSWARTHQYEFPALCMLHDGISPEDEVLYLHTKGVSRIGPPREVGRKWCDYMTWGVVEHWQAMVQALRAGHDVAGVQWTNLDRRYARLCGVPAVFAGNFWWARGEYLLRLAEPKVVHNRYLAEGWVATGSPKVFDFHNLTAQGPVGNKNGPAAPGFSRASYTTDPDPVPVPRPVGAMAVLVRPRRPAAPRTIEPAPATGSGPRMRFSIINSLIERFAYRRYLEIGVERFACWQHIVCETKHCVDPGVRAATFPITSDAFFAQNREQYDIIFIDGLHLEEQVLRDVANSLACLSPGGSIVMHDCNPETEYETRDIPAFDNGGIWLGTTWRAWVVLRSTRPDLAMAVVDTDFGCGVVRRGSQALYVPPPGDLTYATLVRDRKRMLNLVDPEQFDEWIDSTLPEQEPAECLP